MLLGAYSWISPPMAGPQMPRVLFSHSECRAVVVDLQNGEELGDHHVRERAVLEVIAGRVSIATEEETVECNAGLTPWPRPSRRSRRPPTRRHDRAWEGGPP